MDTTQRKVAFITGAASGIGKAIALRFAEEGILTAVADLREDRGEAVVERIKKSGGNAAFVKTDVSRPEEVRHAIHYTTEIFGGLDYAVNNAGIEGSPAETHLQTEDVWDKVIDNNLKGIWLCMKYEIPFMLENGGGSIVNMSSVAGVIGYEGMAPYTASKHGIIGLTKTAALEYALHHIRVNAVCPGVIETEMVERFVGGNPDAAASLTSREPIGRMGLPEEVAEAAFWLCSDKSSFVTGHSLMVDGAMAVR